MSEDDIVEQLEKSAATRRWDFQTFVNNHIAWVIIDERNGRS
jgi:hypothetical protein